MGRFILPSIVQSSTPDSEKGVLFFFFGLAAIAAVGAYRRLLIRWSEATFSTVIVQEEDGGEELRTDGADDEGDVEAVTFDQSLAWRQ